MEKFAGNSWLTDDLFNRTIREYEFTPAAKKQILELAGSERFSEDEAGEIYRMLKNGIPLRSFRDYLRRYIYLKAEIGKPFSSVSSGEYQEIITGAFRENHTPFSWQPTTKRPSQIVKGWLDAQSVRRNSVFLLGFGLRMSAEDVEEFLTKVLHERGFDDQRPEEVIARYCYRAGLGFLQYRKLLSRYEEMKGQAAAQKEQPGEEAEKAGVLSSGEISSEEQLFTFLGRYAASGQSERRSELLREFIRLMEEAWQEISRLYEDYYDPGDVDDVSPEAVRPAVLERVLYSGIPINNRHNLQRMTASQLSRQFEGRRITRQRIDKILKGRDEPDRFDLLTLLFFIFSQKEDDAEPQERLQRFLDRADSLLTSLGMLPVYPANPYEAFLIICLLCEDPFSAFEEIWEFSYKDSTAEN